MSICADIGVAVWTGVGRNALDGGVTLLANDLPFDAASQAMWWEKPINCVPNPTW